MGKATTALIIALYLIGCQLNSSPDFKKEPDPFASHKEYRLGILKDTLIDTTDCLIILELLKKECTDVNARLSFPALKQIRILVPSNKYFLDCNQFTLGKIPVVVNHQDIKINDLETKSTRDEPIRTFYLMDYKRWSTYKSIELFHAPSGSIFKIVVKIYKDKAINDNFLCAKFCF